MDFLHFYIQGRWAGGVMVVAHHLLADYKSGPYPDTSWRVLAEHYMLSATTQTAGAVSQLTRGSTVKFPSMCPRLSLENHRTTWREERRRVRNHTMSHCCGDH